LFFALAFVFLFFYYISSVGHYIWPKILNQFKLYELNIPKAMQTMTVSIFLALIISLNLCLWFIYHIEHPFFEKYKINNEPWPWNDNKTKWNKVIRKTLLLVGFNVFVMTPLSHILDYILNNYDTRYTYDLETLPDTKTLIL
jgi:hypothetical protein